MKPEAIKEWRRIYSREVDALEETLTAALCEAYKEITGKPANVRLREKIADAIRFEAL